MDREGFRIVEMRKSGSSISIGNSTNSTNSTNIGGSQDKGLMCMSAAATASLNLGDSNSNSNSRSSSSMRQSIRESIGFSDKSKIAIAKEKEKEMNLIKMAVAVNTRVKEDGGREVVICSILSFRNQTSRPMEISIRNEFLRCVCECVNT